MVSYFIQQIDEKKQTSKKQINTTMQFQICACICQLMNIMLKLLP